MALLVLILYFEWLQAPTIIVYLYIALIVTHIRICWPVRIPDQSIFAF